MRAWRTRAQNPFVKDRLALWGVGTGLHDFQAFCDQLREYPALMQMLATEMKSEVRMSVAHAFSGLLRSVHGCVLFGQSGKNTDARAHTRRVR